MISHAYAPSVYDCLLPKPRVSTADWSTRHLVLPTESKMKGKYRLDLFPYFREIMDCFDDPLIETITLQTASQVGKTQLAIACLAKMGATNPHPMAFADADERSTKRIIKRMWRTFERCEPLRAVIPPRRLQAADVMTCTNFVIQGAWAGSPASAADYGAFVVVLNETDKMNSASTSSEADFRELMKERTKGYVGFKIVQISTPSLTHNSYIETERLRGDNRAWMVPCPHCRHYQQLRTGNGKTPGGIRFEKLKGRLDPQTARDSAWYECERCQRRIDEHQRFAMLSQGIWCPEGCRVAPDGSLTGTPLRRGSHASFGPLSTLCSKLPGISIGLYAEKIVEALTTTGDKRREKLRNFRNSWEALTWDPQPTSLTEDQIKTRCGVTDPAGVMPEWAAFITRGVDVGRVGDELIFYWLAKAYGRSQRSQILDFGLWTSTAEFLRAIRSQTFPLTTVNGRPVTPVRTFVDSSAFASEVYQLVNPLRALGVWCVKGEEQDPSNPFKRSSGESMWFPGIQREGLAPKIIQAKVQLGAYDLIRPNTYRLQEHLQARLDGLVTKDHPSGLSIPLALFEPDYLPGSTLIEHLKGDFKDQQKGTWHKRYEAQHLRACIRYADCAAFHKMRTEAAWDLLTPIGEEPQPPTITRPSVSAPADALIDDGTYLASDR